MRQVLRTLLSYTHEGLLAILLVALLVYAGHMQPEKPDFLSARLQTGLYTELWDVALLSLPMTFIIITGGIDLSVGSIMALASVTMGLLVQRAGWGVFPAALIALLVGLLCGVLNGLCITRLKVHPLIVTLATMSAFRGLAEGISLPDSYPMPENLYDLVKRPVHWHLTQWPGYYEAGDPAVSHFSFQAAGWIFVVVAALAAVILGTTRFGRSLYAIGHNETAARYSGIKVDRIKLMSYAWAGLMAGLVALDVSFGQSNAKADVGVSMELAVITGVVLGGTSIFGGRGRIIGTVLGVALIHETRMFVKIHYHKDEWVSVVLGLLLILAVAANALLSRKSLKK